MKTVQNRMRHGSAKTTLDVYGHMWEDKDETTRAAIGGAIAARAASSAMFLRALCGRYGRSGTVCAAQRVSQFTRRSTARTTCSALVPVSCVDSAGKPQITALGVLIAARCR